MKKQMVRTFVGFLGLGLMVACDGGGGSRNLSGVQCPSVYDPIPKTVTPGKQKISLVAADRQLPAGVFEYERADLYYVDNSNYRILIADTRQKDGSFKSGISCVRNASTGLGGIAMTTTGVSGLDVSSTAQKVTASIKQYGFTILNGGVTMDFVAKSDKLESPSQAFEGKAEAFMIKHNDTDLEIRSFGQTERGTYALSVVLKRKDPNAPAKAQPQDKK